MTQAHPVPDVHARGSLAIERMTSGTVPLIGACEGTNQIQLRAGIDNPADATQNAIHFAKRSESIDVNGLQAGGLRQQFLVVHLKTPRQREVSKHDRTTTSLHQDSDARHQNVIGGSTGLTFEVPTPHSSSSGQPPDEAAVTVYALPRLRSVTAATNSGAA
jgi:hypothetical protein